MLMRWDPFPEMETLHRGINRMFDGLLYDRENGFAETRFPLMDVSETDEDIKVRLLLPGVKREDVKLSFQQNVLTISGQKKQSEIPEGARLLRGERSSGYFHRTVRLQVPVSESKISAELHDGVLTVTLPRREEVRPKQIEVTVK